MTTNSFNESQHNGSTTINTPVKFLNDKNLSWKAKGILAYALSRNDGWAFSKVNLKDQSSDRESSFDSGIKELEKFGYLHRQRKRGENNQFSGWDWCFFEKPTPKVVGGDL